MTVRVSLTLALHTDPECVEFDLSPELTGHSIREAIAVLKGDSDFDLWFAETDCTVPENMVLADVPLNAEGRIELSLDVPPWAEARRRVVSLGRLYLHATESNPGALVPGPVCCLDTIINDEPITMHVDTGSPRSILSLSWVHKCHLEPHMDTRTQEAYFTPAGEDMTLGDLVNVTVYVNGLPIPSGFWVVAAEDYALLGTDWLFSCEAILNLKDKVIVIWDQAIPLRIQ
jgi:hypothetical protein